MIKIESKKINLSNDPLIKKEGILNKNRINIYKALVRLGDFTKNNKGQFYKKVPYLLDNNKKISNCLNTLPTKYKTNNFIKLRREICRYNQYQKANNLGLRNDTFQKWIKNDCYPLTVVRLISLINKTTDFIEIIKDQYLTNYCRSSKFKLELDPNKLSSFLYYLLGIILGDGTMNKIRLKIVDGHERVEKLDYSRKFLKNIQNQITKTFETKKFKVEKVKNKKCYTTQINNKWVCYYLNFLFGLEFGRKSKPRINKKIEFDCSQENLILRGLFDSDGSADNYKLSFGSIYYGLIKEVERILRKNEIKHIKIREQIRSESNNFYILTIHSESVLTYGKMIGFSHPRKIKEFKKYLLSKPTKRKLKHSKENTLFEIGKYLRPIANRKIRPTKAFFELGEVKKNRIITIFNRRFNMNFYEVLRPNLHINNRKLTREFNDIFEYKLIKTAVPIDQITSMERKWTKIWD